MQMASPAASANFTGQRIAVAEGGSAGVGKNEPLSSLADCEAADRYAACSLIA